MTHQKPCECFLQSTFWIWINHISYLRDFTFFLLWLTQKSVMWKSFFFFFFLCANDVMAKHRTLNIINSSTAPSDDESTQWWWLMYLLIEAKSSLQSVCTPRCPSINLSTMALSNLLYEALSLNTVYTAVRMFELISIVHICARQGKHYSLFGLWFLFPTPHVAQIVFVTPLNLSSETLADASRWKQVEFPPGAFFCYDSRGRLLSNSS